MDKKTTAIVAYITIIGWLVSFFTYKNAQKDSLPSYHLRQALGLFITVFAINIVLNILIIVLASISLSVALVVTYVSYAVSLCYLVLMIVGAMTANKEEEKPLPIIGKMFEGKFNFIP